MFIKAVKFSDNLFKFGKKTLKKFSFSSEDQTRNSFII